MTVSWFVHFEKVGNNGTFCNADRAHVRKILQRTPGLLRAHIFTPTVAGGPFTSDPRPPQLALQLDFANLPTLEASIGPDGVLRALALPNCWTSLEGADVSHQAMIARQFPVHEEAPSESKTPDRTCSYLVHYPGCAADLNKWLLHYLTHHPRLMARLPAIREIEIFTRLDWCDVLPWRRVHHMQRNRITFDSAAAMTSALESAALHDLRADYHRFPRFKGGNIHYPMETETLTPQSGL